MAISFVGVETATSPSGMTHSVSRPAAAAAGDVALLTATPYVTDSGVTITPPDGFDPVADVQVGNATTRSLVWLRVLGGNEPATYAVTTSESRYTEVACVVYRGVDTQDAAATENAGAGATRTATGLTTVTDGARIVVFSAAWSNGAATPDGMTERAAWDGIAYIWDEARPTAGATGDRTAAMGAADIGWTAIMVALRAEGAPPPDTRGRASDGSTAPAARAAASAPASTARTSAPGARGNAE